MTEGTSKGLFIVVAIVIFGIFVGLTYTLFGSEGLTKDIKIIFETPIDKINNSSALKTVTFKDWKPVVIKANDSVQQLDNGFLIDSSGTAGLGLILDSTYINHGQEYELSFDITKISGDITRIGGHSYTLEGTQYNVYIDDVLVGHEFNVNTQPYIFDNTTHNVRVTFVGTLESNTETVGFINNSIYIQPNRYYGTDTSIKNYGKPYKAKIENILFKEI